MKIVWTAEAIHDLDAIYNFYLIYNSTFVASLYDEIVDSSEQLLLFPEMAPRELLLEDKPQLPRSLVVCRMFKIIYYIQNEIIYITNIWDCRKEPERLVRSNSF